MRSNLRCVFDTNVLVSALLFDRSKLARAFFVALRAGEVLVSADVISELSDVLGREKFRHYVNEEEHGRFLRSLLRETTLVEVREAVRACRDPKDDKFLELAVSGDEDLLTLDPFGGIRILTPDGFLKALPRGETAE